ncbi:MAG TPA: hypothetical protein VF288_14410 [Mycobacteriales bacterium]
MTRYGVALLAAAVLLALWFLFAVAGDLVDALVGLVTVAAALVLVVRAAPTLQLRSPRVSVPVAALALAVPRDIVSGTWRVLRGRWPGRRRVLRVPDRRLANQADRALAGVALCLGPATYLVSDDPLTVHQLGRGAGAVADRLLDP